MDRRALIIGVGNRMCGDDAVGVVAAARLARTLGDLAHVVTDEKVLWDVVDGTERAELLVVIDAAAASSSLPVGAWCRLEHPADADVLDEHAFGNTHSLNLRSMLDLAEGLGTLPGTVWIYGMAGATFSRGSPLSPPVEGRLPALERRIETDVRSWLKGAVCTSSQSPGQSATS